MAERATVGETASDPRRRVEVADAIANARPLALHSRPLPLEELAAALDRTKWIAADDEDRRVGRIDVAPARADLLDHRFPDPEVDGAGGLCRIRQLRSRRNSGQRQNASRHTNGQEC